MISIVDAPIEVKIAIVVALVEVFKYLFGSENKSAVLVSIFSGIVIEIAVALGKTFPELIPWVDHAFGGVLIGLIASGFYRLTKRGVNGIVEAAARAVLAIPTQAKK